MDNFKLLASIVQTVDMSKELKTAAEIFEDNNYLFICEFSEIEGATAWYVYPEFEQKFPDNKYDEDVCVRKRLARQFLSSDHCKQSCDDSLHLAKNAKFYQEIEISEVPGDKSNPINLYAVGIFFKLYDFYSRGNVKACCLALVTSDLDRMSLMRAVWMRKLSNLVCKMKKSNIFFHYYQVSDIYKTCLNLKDDILETDNLRNMGLPEDFHETKALSSKKLLKELRLFIRDEYLRDKSVMTDDEENFKEVIKTELHKDSLCEFKDESHEMRCPHLVGEVDPEGVSEDIAQRLKNGRISRGNLPCIKILMGCQNYDNEWKRVAEAFNQPVEIRCLDENEGFRDVVKFIECYDLNDDNGEVLLAFQHDRMWITFGTIRLSALPFLMYYKNRQSLKSPSVSQSQSRSISVSRAVTTPTQSMQNFDFTNLPFPGTMCGESYDAESLASSQSNGSLEDCSNGNKNRSSSAFSFSRFPEQNKKVYLVADLMLKKVGTKRQNSVPDKPPINFTKNSYDVRRIKKESLKSLLTTGVSMGRAFNSDNQKLALLKKYPEEMKTVIFAALVGSPIAIVDHYGRGHSSSDDTKPVNLSKASTGTMKLFFDIMKDFLFNYWDQNIVWFDSQNDQIQLASHMFSLEDSIHTSPNVRPIRVAISKKDFIVPTIHNKPKFIIPEFDIYDDPGHKIKSFYSSTTSSKFVEKVVVVMEKDIDCESQRILYITTCLLEKLHRVNFWMCKSLKINGDSQILMLDPPGKIFSNLVACVMESCVKLVSDGYSNMYNQPNLRNDIFRRNARPYQGRQDQQQL